MKFPIIKELATKNVVSVDFDVTLNEAIELMYKYNHRNVIVINENNFYILTASDLLQLKLKEYNFSAKLSTVKLEKIPTIDKEENILDTIEFFEHSMEYICAVNEDGSLYGILTHTDIISHINPETLMENYRIGDLMNMNKHIQKTSQDTISSEVLKNMADNKYDCIVIINNDLPIGILTTKDVMELIKSSHNLNTPISNYMSSPIETINEDASIKEAINFMKEKHFKRIVVTNSKNVLTGLILQRELISLSYSKWSVLMREYSSELSEINNLLEKKTKKYEKMASTDQLTGLYNRYKFTELFHSEFHTMEQRENSMCVMMIDIDYFKTVNDKYGHNIGDSVLLQTSNILLKHFRNVDVVSRWGGEEFIILLPTATIENGKKIAEKIRESLSLYDMGKGLKITASFGITEVKVGDCLEMAIKRADDALYEAKSSGRNCVKVQL
ncbi:MAG: diguanylate cyclase [Campylobacterota bacterium]|nr:diguanylate cyclase [Campylobacterota bacterium]